MKSISSSYKSQTQSLPLVLASTSPRRRRLLAMLGLDFSVDPSEVDESAIPADSPLEFAINAAAEKCMEVVRRQTGKALVLGADTVVCVNLKGESWDREWSSGFRLFPAHHAVILGKPSDPPEATEMLSLLADRTHQVITAVAVSSTEGNPVVEAETTDVRFRALNNQEIADYIGTGEPMDKAGAYGVQGLGAKFIQSVDGDLSNVIGLPLALTIRMLHPYYGNLALPSDDELRKEAYRL